jgi:vesicle-associated membrane protein 7
MGKGGGNTSCIIHSLVAYEEKILASCSSPLKESAYDAQVCSVLSEKVLKKICARMHNHKKTYITEKYHFHYIMEDGIVFMCVAQAVHGQRLPFSFLKDIREKWHSKYRLRESMQARPYDMNQTFQSILKQKMLYYSDDTTDKLREVMEKVEDVKGTMLSNVEDDDDDFEVSAGGKTKICLKRITILFCVCLCCTIFILGALYVAGVFVCGGWTLQKCTNAVWNAF